MLLSRFIAHLKLSALFCLLSTLFLYVTLLIGLSQTFTLLSVIPPFIIWFLILLIPTVYQVWLIKMHLVIENRGWKRLLLVMTVLATVSVFAIDVTPLALDRVITAEIDNLAAFYLMFFYVYGAIIYTSILSVFFLIKWIVDGFNHHST